MASVRPVQLLLCFAYLTQTSVYAAYGSCDCPDAKNLGFFTDMPCQECPDGHYRTCDRGSYYAHHPTMCIYATRQEDFTHEEASDWCTKYDVSGFLAFAGDLEESYQISHFVWNWLKNGVQGNETYFWLGGTLELIDRGDKPQTVASFKYRDYKGNVTEELRPTDIDKAIREGRTCLAGHTENHTTLHALDCNEKLPAVCYNYRQRPTRLGSCKQEPGKQWTFFQGKCYYVHSARSNRDKKTYFDAQRECAEMNSILATVTDRATFKKTLELATGLEKIVDLDEGTWIGLQLSGRGYGGIYYNITDGSTRPFTKFREDKGGDPPEVPPGQTEGWWEDGTRYDDVALKSYWAHMAEWAQDSEGQWFRWEWDQPNEEQLRNPHLKKFEVGRCSDYPKEIPADYNHDRCKKDKFQHCTQIFPGGTDAIINCGDKCLAYSAKWNDRWCYFRQRGYICQRDAVSEKDPYRRNDEL